MSIKEVENANDLLIKRYIEKYTSNQKPIAISFRDIHDNLTNGERYTHLIHSYPAKLLMHIPYFFLNNTFFSKKGNVVLDPFCGTGTVLLESILAGRKAIGADANPLARIITSVKTNNIGTERLSTYLNRIIIRAKGYQDATIPDVVNINHWFSTKTQIDLAKILKSIEVIRDKEIRNFFLVSFSNCIKKVSYADPRISVPVKLNPLRFEKGTKEQIKIVKRILELENINVFEKFSSISTTNIERLSKLGKTSQKARVISEDARNLTSGLDSKKKLRANSVSLIITSPPYAGAQKYIRSSSLNLGWTNLASSSELLKLDKKNIGRENFKKEELIIMPTGILKADKLIKQISKIDKTRAKIINQYLIEMNEAIIESIRVLKKGGYFVLIVGNNKVCNKEFNTQEYLTEIAKKNGLKLIFKLIDDIKSYGLMTKRNKTADIISREWILVFKKI